MSKPNKLHNNVVVYKNGSSVLLVKGIGGSPFESVLLCGLMENTFAGQLKVSSAVQGSFNHFDTIDLSIDLSIAPRTVQGG